MPSTQTHAFQSLARQLAAGQLRTEPAELLTYEIDAGLDRARPDGVVYPRSTADVERIAGWSAAHGVPLVARGAGTGLSGGAIAEHGGLVVQFSQMSRVLAFDEAGRSVVVQPGAINLELDALVRAKGLYFPPDPSSQRASTLGGNIAENSGGPHCFKYGVTTNYVTGLEIVLAGGQRLRLGGRALDYPEYDLVGLLTGSEGTLAIVTEASLRLVRNPPAVKTLMVAFESVESAGEAVSALISRGLVPATLEMMDQKIMRIIEDFVPAGLPTSAGAALIVEVDGYPDGVAPQIDEIAMILGEHEARDLRIAQTAAQRDAIWWGRKSAAGAMSRLAPAYYLVDVSVPRSKLAPALAQINQICEDLELRVGYVFHAGDGNLHPLILIEEPSNRELVARVLQAGRQIAELSVAYDGSITGEHGVGIEKREYMPLMYSPAELDAMRDVKQVFDPAGLLNPGKILPPGADDRRPANDERQTTVYGRDISRPNRPPTGDTSGAITPSPLHPFTPTTAHEAAEAIHELTQAGRSIRIRGGGTKSHGLRDADVLLSTSGLRGIHSFAREDLYVTVGAGTPFAELQAELAGARMWAPLASPWPNATIGGLISTNWNAPLRMRYGAARDTLMAATVALGDGRVIRAGRPVVKNVAGYDMPKAFVGAHGTLGLLADVTLRLIPLPRARASLVVPVEDLARGLEWGARLRRVCLNASALLLASSTPALPEIAAPFALIYSVEGLPEDVAAELAEARAVLADAGDIQEVDAPSGSDWWASWLSSDDALTIRAGAPAGELPALLRETAAGGEHPSLLADLANGMLYVRGVNDIPALQAAARARGGYATIQPTPGAAGYAFDRWGYQPEGIELMRGLRQRWGAGGLLNPGAFLV
jgi:D-lactate dehydrogenase (cytochrome)